MLVTRAKLKTVKIFLNQRYEVSLLQHPDDEYYVISKEYSTGKERMHRCSDYLMASSVFDIKLQELEGN